MMIVSDAEITRVLELIRQRTGRPSAQPILLVPLQPPSEDLDSQTRLLLVDNLREMLAAGAYEIRPELLADKIIGRAICDQVHHLLEDPERRAASAN